jgi:hypothetical protein
VLSEEVGTWLLGMALRIAAFSLLLWAGGCPATGSPALISTQFAGRDHGTTIPDWAGPSSTPCHKVTLSDFPAGWPAELQVPGNCYAKEPGKQVQKPAFGTSKGSTTWQLEVLINAPHADTRRFYEGHFARLGALEPPKAGAENGTSWAVACTPRNTQFSRYRAVVTLRPEDRNWSTLTVEAVSK